MVLYQKDEVGNYFSKKVLYSCNGHFFLSILVSAQKYIREKYYSQIVINNIYNNTFLFTRVLFIIKSYILREWDPQVTH